MPSKILLETISHLLANKANDTTPILQTRRVSGGDINAAARLSTKKAEYFIKWNPRPLPGMFLAEARGLAELEKGGELRVPHVFAHAEVKNDVPAFILMEWLGGNASKISPSLSENLGRGLAALHRRTQPKYGWRYDNYIGALPQSNTESTDWIAFYREKRLGVQLELAAKSSRLPSYRRRQLERLMANLDRWIDPAAVQPSLLHGDLWGGNYIAGPSGEPVLIDPAVYYGDREVELAFTELFGGFSQTFYRAYNESWPLSPGYQERKRLYQLYYLLVHLNMFGEGYGGSVDGILSYYTGNS